MIYNTILLLGALYLKIIFSTSDMLTTFFLVMHIDEAIISIIGYETTNLISTFMLQNRQMPTINDTEKKCFQLK